MSTAYMANNWVAHVNKLGQSGTSRVNCHLFYGNKSTATPFDVSNHQYTKLCQKSDLMCYNVHILTLNNVGHILSYH